MVEDFSHVGHRQRLRNRFSSHPESLAEYELLELLLFLSVPRKDVKPIAKKLLKQFKSLRALLSLSKEDLSQVEGVTPATVSLFLLVRFLSSFLLRQEISAEPVLSNFDLLMTYCQSVMAHLPIEQFRLLFLNKRYVLIADEVQQNGTIDHTPIYVREVVRRALQLNACYLIMVHNHPSGDPSPSKADVDCTVAMAHALEQVKVVLLDHIVVARYGMFSFQQQGML